MTSEEYLQQNQQGMSSEEYLSKKKQGMSSQDYLKQVQTSQPSQAIQERTEKTIQENRIDPFLQTSRDEKAIQNIVSNLKGGLDKLGNLSPVYKYIKPFLQHPEVIKEMGTQKGGLAGNLESAAGTALSLPKQAFANPRMTTALAVGAATGGLPAIMAELTGMGLMAPSIYKGIFHPIAEWRKGEEISDLSQSFLAGAGLGDVIGKSMRIADATTRTSVISSEVAPAGPYIEALSNIPIFGKMMLEPRVVLKGLCEDTLEADISKRVFMDKYARQASDILKTNKIRSGSLSEESVIRALDGQITGKEFDGLLRNEKSAYTGLRSWFDELAKEFDIPQSKLIREYFPHLFKKLNNAEMDDTGALLTSKKLGEPWFKKTRKGDFSSQINMSLTEVLSAYLRGGAKVKFLQEPIKAAQAKIETMEGGFQKSYAKEWIEGMKGRPSASIDDVLSNGELKDTHKAENFSRSILVDKIGVAVDTIMKHVVSRMANLIAETGFVDTLKGATGWLAKGFTKAGKKQLQDNNVIVPFSQIVEAHEGILKSIPSKILNSSLAGINVVDMGLKGIAFHDGFGRWLVDHPGDIEGAMKAGVRVSRNSQLVYGQAENSPYFNQKMPTVVKPLMVIPIKQFNFLLKQFQNKGVLGGAWSTAKYMILMGLAMEQGVKFGGGGKSTAMKVVNTAFQPLELVENIASGNVPVMETAKKGIKDFRGAIAGPHNFESAGNLIGDATDLWMRTTYGVPLGTAAFGTIASKWGTQQGNPAQLLPRYPAQLLGYKPPYGGYGQ